MAIFAGTGSGMQNDAMHQPVSNLPREFTQLFVLHFLFGVRKHYDEEVMAKVISLIQKALRKLKPMAFWISSFI